MNVFRDEQTKQHFIEANRMRTDNQDSVLWAIVRGRGSAPRIALMLGWPPSMVEKQLATLRDEGLINENENSWTLNRDHDEYVSLMEMRQVYFNLEKQIAAEYPRAKIEEGYFARSVYEELSDTLFKDKSRTRDLVDRWVLTNRQWDNMRIIRDLEGDIFSTRSYMIARGTSKGQFAKNELIALMKKGMVQVAHKRGKGDWWEVTPFGVEYKHEPVTEVERRAILSKVSLGEPEVRRYRVSGPREDLLSLLLAGGMTTKDLADKREVSRSAVHRQLSRAAHKGLVRRETSSDGSNVWYLNS